MGGRVVSVSRVCIVDCVSNFSSRCSSRCWGIASAYRGLGVGLVQASGRRSDSGVVHLDRTHCMYPA